ncbi:MAG: hypothetical protein E7599_04930 [Ruminococcaceae bacterium]|nr:hypothetical protein [Oscillospiraceae bacterium]
MPRIITNYATLDYFSENTAQTVISNVAQTTLRETLGITKDAYQGGYRIGERLTYIVQIVSTGQNPSSLTVVDDLGTFAENGVMYTPLDYESYLLYVGQTLNPETGGVNVTVNVQPGSVRFTFDNLPTPFPGMTLLMQMRVNRFAPFSLSSQGITNTTELVVGGETVASDSATVLLQSYADLRILKSMTPDPVTQGETLTYTFVICNYGTASPDSVTLRDRFNPAPAAPLEVKVDGETVDLFDYDPSTGMFVLGAAATQPYTFVLPPAGSVRDTQTGVVTVQASKLTVTVSGVIAQ